ncbi:hypothetical protein R6Q59_016785 [Mikania micrantha]
MVPLPGNKTTSSTGSPPTKSSGSNFNFVADQLAAIAARLDSLLLSKDEVAALTLINSLEISANSSATSQLSSPLEVTRENCLEISANSSATSQLSSPL